MKHIAGETGTRSVSPETVHLSTITAATSHTGGMPPARRFTADELRNLPRPPGDYSWLENKLSDFYRDFLHHGILPEHWDDLEVLSAFCTDNKLADALSYLCVKANLKELKIEPYYSEYDAVGFICSWAQTIDFEIALAFGQLESDQTSLPLLQMLENSPTVKHVKISFFGTSQEFQAVLFQAFRNNTSIEKLFLWGISCDVIDDVAELIHLNPTIKHLFFEHEEGVREEAAKRLCESIGKNTSLISLEMNMCFFSQYLGNFLTMLEKNLCLESLVIQQADFLDDDVRALATVLGKNERLRNLEISMQSASINAFSAVLLLGAVKTNDKLTSLSLRLHYSRTDEDESDVARALGELIRVNTALQSFSLDFWERRDTSATEIADALPLNTCIQALQLTGNFDQTAISKIVKSLSRPGSKSALSNLSIRNSQSTVFSSPVDDIALLIRSNTKLESIRLHFYYDERTGLLSPEEMGALSAAVQSNHTLIDFELLLATNFIESGGGVHNDMDAAHQETIEANDSTLIEHVKQYGPHYEEFVSKIRANAEARKLRLGTVLALGVLAPEIPTELFEIIADKLTFRNEEAPQESGTAAMRHLAKMVGAD